LKFFLNEHLKISQKRTYTPRQNVTFARTGRLFHLSQEHLQ